MKHITLLTVVCFFSATESPADDKPPIFFKVPAPVDAAAADAIDFPKQIQAKAIEDNTAEFG